MDQALLWAQIKGLGCRRQQACKASLPCTLVEVFMCFLNCCWCRSREALLHDGWGLLEAGYGGVRLSCAASRGYMPRPVGVRRPCAGCYGQEPVWATDPQEYQLLALLMSLEKRNM